MEAISAFNGHNWNGYELEVKFADQDAGPPLSGKVTTSIFYNLCREIAFPPANSTFCLAGSGATPSDNLYIRVSCSNNA